VIKKGSVAKPVKYHVVTPQVKTDKIVRFIEYPQDRLYLTYDYAIGKVCGNMAEAFVLQAIMKMIENKATDDYVKGSIPDNTTVVVQLSREYLYYWLNEMFAEKTIWRAMESLVQKGLLFKITGKRTSSDKIEANSYSVNFSLLQKLYNEETAKRKEDWIKRVRGKTPTSPFDRYDIQYIKNLVDGQDVPTVEPEISCDILSEPNHEDSSMSQLQLGQNVPTVVRSECPRRKETEKNTLKRTNTDSSESYVNSRLHEVYRDNQNSSGNENSRVYAEENCRSTVAVLEEENVDSYPSLSLNNSNPKTNSIELENVYPNTEEEKKTSSRLEVAPSEHFFNMDDVKAVVSTYHRTVPMKGRPKGDGSVNALLSKYGNKVESLLSDYSVEELEEGIGRFMDDDFWKKKGYPMNGFISQVDRFAGNAPRSDFRRSPLVGYQKPETIEPDPVCASIPPTPEEQQARRFRLRVQELRKMAIRCRMDESDFDLGTAEAVESNFGRVASIFEEMHGYPYPVTTSPCKT